jgi:hypothetical protein
MEQLYELSLKAPTPPTHGFSKMVVDGIFWWLYSRAQEAGYLHLYGMTSYVVVENYASHLTSHIQKLHASKLLSLLRLPEA